ncbi:MAG: beta-lactamase family protein [Gemmatimonadetes bacterium]|nr:beta-lactamase family protein [Gemmatimonadota bacterium]
MRSMLALLLTSSLAAQAMGQDPLSSQAPPPTYPVADRLARLSAGFGALDRLFRDFAEQGQVPGIGYGVIVDGKLVHLGTHGVRDVGRKAPVDTSSVFRIASMTKSFTALAILQLRDAGRLSLDDPAERFVPELRALRYPTSDAPRITIRQLLTHSEGFPEDNPWGDQQLAATDRQMSAMMRRGIPFSTVPGTAYEYSNYGFAILGRIIANVSGVPYPRYIQRRILGPLGMRVTTLEAASVPSSRLALGYRRQDDRWVEEPQLPDGSFGPMGGMLTSIGDLGRYVAFLLDAWPARDGADSGPVRRASVREMQQIWRYNGATVGRDSTGAATLSAGGYGYGLGIRETCRFGAVVSHSGGLPGFGSQMRWLPDYGVGLVALGNLTYTGWGPVLDQALAALAATGGLVPRQPSPAPVLLTRRDQVTRLVATWNDALADSLAAMNLYLDEPKPRRQAALARLREQVGGNCRNEGPFLAANALRGQWKIRCDRGDLAVAITLAPIEPATVQQLDIRPSPRDEVLAPDPTCR